ncbi:MAG: hypothetical protein WBM04_18590 [Candidatus Korobacteraceae bacterium]
MSDTNMKHIIATVTLAVVALMATVSACAQMEGHPRRTRDTQEQTHPDARLRAESTVPIYHRSDTWYEFLLKQFNPENFNYGDWMEERRQIFLDASARNPYFKYSAGVTIALLMLMAVCAKQWIDHRRVLWVTAEMMTDLYNHDLYSRDVAEKAIEKYNQHIERCNRGIEASQHDTAVPGVEADDAWRTKLQQVVEERDRYLRERDVAQRELDTNRRTLAELSLRLDSMAAKSGTNGKTGASVELSTADPAVVRHINNLQEQIYAERETNKRLKGA